MSKLACPDCGEGLICPDCGPVEMAIAAAKSKPSRLRARLAVLMLVLAAVGGCAWWVFVK